jgi:carboxyl-terminal processing protease
VESAFDPIKEADLSGHLINGNGKAEQKTSTGKTQAVDEKPLAQSDYQLYEALNLLKGLAIQRAQMK